MTLIKDMTRRERRVYNACANGWFMSGLYSAEFDEHRREFWADSPRILYGQVNHWYDKHRENHANSNLLVKCLRAG